MRLRRLVGSWLSIAALLLACNGATPLSAEMPEPAATNPDGLAYPTDHIGTEPRRKGRTGDRIANLAFRGRRGGGAEGELTTLSLADYYDPSARDHRVLYIFSAAKWCSICARVATNLERKRAELEAQGARVLVLLVNGDEQGDGPSLEELNAWAQTHPIGADLGVDVGANAMIRYGLAGVPFNMLIDTRTMEILDAQMGEPVDIGKYVGAGLQLTSQAPAYPLP